MKYHISAYKMAMLIGFMVCSTVGNVMALDTVEQDITIQHEQAKGWASHIQDEHSRRVYMEGTHRHREKHETHVSKEAFTKEEHATTTKKHMVHKGTDKALAIVVGENYEAHKRQVFLDAWQGGLRETGDDMAYNQGVLGLVYQKGKWGLVDKAGEMIVPPTYKELTYIGDGVFRGTGKVHVEYIDSTGKKVANPAFEGKTHFYRENGRYGIVSATGERVTSPIYRRVVTPFQEQIAFVEIKHKKVVAINEEGQVLFQAPSRLMKAYAHGLAEYRYPVHSFRVGMVAGMIAQHYMTDQGVVFTEQNDVSTTVCKRGYIDHAGNIIIDAKYDVVYPLTKWGTFVGNKGRLQFVNTKGKTVIAAGNYRIQGKYIDFVSGRAALQDEQTGKFSVWSLDTGKNISVKTYDDVVFLHKQFWAGRINNTLVIVAADTGNELFVLPNMIRILPFGNEEYTWVFSKDHTYSILHRSGRIVYTAPKGSIRSVMAFKHGHTAVRYKTKWAILDAKGNIVLDNMPYETVKLV